MVTLKSAEYVQAHKTEISIKTQLQSHKSSSMYHTATYTSDM